MKNIRLFSIIHLTNKKIGGILHGLLCYNFRKSNMNFGDFSAFLSILGAKLQFTLSSNRAGQTGKISYNMLMRSNSCSRFTPPPLYFTRSLSERFFYVRNHVINSLCLSTLRNHPFSRWRSWEKTIFPKNGQNGPHFSPFSLFGGPSPPPR